MPWMDGWWMGGMWIGTVMFLAVIAVLAWAFARAMGYGGPRAGVSPEQILKQRYARGEIETDEYEKRLSELRK